MCNSKGCCSGKDKCTMARLSVCLLIIGGLNWGLVGLGTLLGGKDWNLVHMLLGSWATVEAVVYVLVGLAALMKIFSGCRCHKCAGGGMDKGANMEASM